MGNHQSTLNARDGNVTVQAGTIEDGGTSGLNQGKDDALEHLPYVAQATINHADKQHDPTCLPGTRVSVLQEIYEWGDSQDEPCVFWLTGWAGTGKSTIARTVAREYNQTKRLGASFFFSRGGGDQESVRYFVTTIARQLANSSTILKKYICEAVEDNRDIINMSVDDQWCRLIFRPLLRLDKNTTGSPYILVVDAVDECEKNRIGIILRLLTETRSKHLRLFITSRTDFSDIYPLGFKAGDDYRSIVLHDIEPETVNGDISRFLRHSLEAIQHDRPLEEIVESLVPKSGGLFVWAATAIRFICEGTHLSADRLSRILDTSGPFTRPEEQLNKLYIAVLEAAIPSPHTAKQKTLFYETMGYALGSMLILCSPLSFEALYALLDINGIDVQEILNSLRPILDVTGNTGHLLRLHHPSFRDFLLSSTGSSNEYFRLDEESAHRILLIRCLEQMSDNLRQDICGLKSPGTLMKDIEEGRVEKAIPHEVQYACLYWIKHVERGRYLIFDNDRICDFLKNHFLHWLEALALMGEVYDGLNALISLSSMTSAEECPELHDLVQDTVRFTRHNQEMMEHAPLQIYLGALVFAPHSSPIGRMFRKAARQWIKYFPCGVRNDWGPLLHTLEGHTEDVRAVAISKNSRLLATGSDDRTIRLWDPATGQCLQVIVGHESSVTCLRFSKDGGILASVAKNDPHIRIWNPETGHCVQSLVTWDSDMFSTIAFLDKQESTILSVSCGLIIRYWSLKTGQGIRVIKEPCDSTSFLFSECGRTLVSWSDAVGEQTFYIWNITDADCRQEVTVRSWKKKGGIALSKDGKILALGHEGIELWNTETGELLRECECYRHKVDFLAFSLDDRILAEGSLDGTSIRFLDPLTGGTREVLVGQYKAMSAIPFSESSKMMASISPDSKVRLWDTTPNRYAQDPDLLRIDHPQVNGMKFIKNGKILVSESRGGVMRLWDSRNGCFLKTLQYGGCDYSKIVFLRDRKVLVSGYVGGAVRMNDSINGKCLRTFVGHDGVVDRICVSKDETVMASSASDKTIKVWILRSGNLLYTLEDQSGVTDMVFSDHGAVLAVALAGEYNIQICRLLGGLLQGRRGGLLGTLDVRTIKQGGESRALPRKMIIFEGGKTLAAALGEGTIQLWNIHTGESIRTLPGHRFPIRLSLSLAGNSKILASADCFGNIKIWDPSNGQCIKTIQLGYPLASISLDPTGHYLNTNRGSLRLDLEGFGEYGFSEEQESPLYVDGSWITQNGRKICWIPCVYRLVRHVAVHGNRVALGYDNGVVIAFEFRPPT